MSDSFAQGLHNEGDEPWLTHIDDGTNTGQSAFHGLRAGLAKSNLLPVGEPSAMAGSAIRAAADPLAMVLHKHLINMRELDIFRRADTSW